MQWPGKKYLLLKNKNKDILIIALNSLTASNCVILCVMFFFVLWESRWCFDLSNFICTMFFCFLRPDYVSVLIKPVTCRLYITNLLKKDQGCFLDTGLYTNMGIYNQQHSGSIKRHPLHSHRVHLTNTKRALRVKPLTKQTPKFLQQVFQSLITQATLLVSSISQPNVAKGCMKPNTNFYDSLLFTSAKLNFSDRWFCPRH